MAAHSTATQLNYALLQMAAESLFEIKQLTDAPGKTSTTMTVESLVNGNTRSSRFTDVQAKQFIEEWQLVEHKSNTESGFSGTLFKYIGETDPARGLTKDQLVMSFRSTEFADDAARDNQATNALEIKELGWAFGQIADMEDWYAQLKDDGNIPAGASFSVTGYSLGGHLATAFNLLRYEEERSLGIANPITETYTFNGAGVGELLGGTSLLQVMQQFTSERDQSHASFFQTMEATQLYASLASLMAPGSVDALTEALLRATSVREAARLSPAGPGKDLLLEEIDLLYHAVDRARTVVVEAARVQAGISHGNGGADAQPVDASHVAAIKLDYQLAVLRAAQATSPFASGILDGLGAAYATERAPLTLLGLPPIYDIYGAPSPSAVANSQQHYGQPTPVYIEDQPVMRGAVVPLAVWETLLFGEVKLLVDNFGRNDFGDTHSLVLLVDSLSVQNLLATLDPNVTTATLNTVLQAASNSRVTGGGQGTAEGDTLEHVLDGLRRMLLGPSVTDTAANMTGGTWADLPARNLFYDNLGALAKSPQYTSLVGRVSVAATAGDASLPTRARNDFSALVTLLTLSPVTLTLSDPTAAGAVEATLGNVWSDAFAQWQADQSLTEEQRADGQANFTDTYLHDRQALLQSMEVRNLRNLQSTALLMPEIDQSTNYSDLASGIHIELNQTNTAEVTKAVVFGSEAGEAIAGHQADDHLYGGGGSDTVSGNDGSDYLEGNAGNDTLAGGQGDDQLLGGSGTDTYEFSADFGRDLVIDQDGLGEIRWNGAALPQGLKVLEGIWQSADRSVTYTLIADANGTRQDLVISFSGSKNRIVVRGWDENTRNLGVTFGGDMPRPETVNNFLGDFKKKNDGEEYEIVNGNYVSDGQEDGAADQITGGASNEMFFGLGGNDAILARGGDDVLDGGAGVDVLQGGLGKDWIIGGEGSDVIYGSSQGSVVNPVRVDFAPPQTSHPVVQGYGFNWVESGIRDEEGFYNGSLSTTVQRDDGEGDEANVIDAGSGEDFIAAGQANDVVSAGSEGDAVFGMAGDDVLSGGDGADHIFGDGPVTGDDFYVVDAPGAVHGADIIVGGAGNDRLMGQGGDDIIFGGADNDKIWGDERDVSSTPVQFHGSDLIFGGTGEDEIYGGGGDDDISGDDDDDMLHGDDFGSGIPLESHGNDRLNGGSGDDHLLGGGGNDTLLGGADNDVLEGGEGNDYLDGGTGFDGLLGEAGNDTLVSDGGGDTLAGGADNDTYRVAFTQADVAKIDDTEGINFLAGVNASEIKIFSQDGQIVVAHGTTGMVKLANAGTLATLRVVADPATGVMVSLQSLLDSRSAGNLMSGSWVAGQGVVDTAGIGTAQSLVGTDAADEVRGGSGNDALFGLAGNDVLLAGAGVDSLDGGDGNDLLASDGNDYLDGGSGDDIFHIALQSHSTVDGVTTVTAAVVNDGQGSNTIVIDGLSVDAAQLSVFSQNGSTYLAIGGEGLVALGPQVDLQSLSVVDGAGQSHVLATLPGVNTATGRVHTGVWEAGVGVTATQDITTAQEISGSDFAEDVGGGGESDRVDAGGGDDILTGNAGADHLSGGAGQDRIDGGAGNDTLYGGHAGRPDVQRDTFVFNVGDGTDEIVFDGAQLNAQARDVIEFGAGITLDDLIVSNLLAGSSDPRTQLVIEYGTDDRIVLSPGGEAGIHSVRFADGSEVLISTLVSRLPPRGIDAHQVQGSDADDTLTGTAGNDLVQGFGGDDVLAGAGGRDVLVGGTGSNTYRFGAAGGHAMVMPTQGEAGLLQFESVGLGGASARIEGEDLVVLYGEGGYVRVPGYAVRPELASQWQIQFDGQAAMTLGEFVQAAPAPRVTDLDERRAQFLDQQQWQLATTMQRAADDGIPIDVVQVQHSVQPGQVFQHESYLEVVDTEETQTYVTRRPVYSSSTTLGSQAGSQPGRYIPIESMTGQIPANAVAVWGQAREGGGSSHGSMAIVGYVVPSGSASAGLSTTPHIVGWETVTSTRTVTTSSDIAQQALIVGTDGGDVVVPGASTTSRPVLFRGTIDTGAGDDVIQLSSGYNSFFQGALERNQDWGRSTVGGYGYMHELSYHYDRGLGAWIDAGTGHDLVVGTDGHDVIIGGTGNNLLDGQAGADTYLISAREGETDRIADVAEFDWARDSTFVSYGGDLDHSNRDTVEFDGSVALADLSYRWNPLSAEGEGYVTLELLRQGTVFLQIDYAQESANGLVARALTPEQVASVAKLYNFLDGSLRPEVDDVLNRQVSMPGVERFVFADGTTLGIQELLGTIPAVALPPPNILLNGSAGYDALLGGAGNDTLNGHAGHDHLLGGAGNDQLAGGAGNDVLRGGEGGDTYAGGTGTDLLADASVTSADTYAYELGDGADTVSDAGGVDTVQLGAGISVAGTLVRRSLGRDLILRFSDGGSLTLGDQVGAEGASLPAGQIEQVVFADGTVWDQAQMRALALIGSSGDDVIVGFDGGSTIDAGAGNDLVIGGAGDDTLRGDEGADDLRGGAGNDLLAGGAGNDALDGSAGDDTYEYALGDGADTVRDNFEGVDTVRLGPGILASETIARRDIQGALVLEFADGGSLSLLDQYAGGGGPSNQYRIDEVVFADGTVWDRDRLDQLAAPLGTEGPDLMTGSEVNDVLDGQGGNDNIYGGGGNDTLLGGGGDDQLYGETGADNLRGGDGSDWLAGGEGDDRYEGNAGNDGMSDTSVGSSDTYLYRLGDGRDTISDSGGVDTVRLGPGITASNINVVYGNGSLSLEFVDGGSLLLSSQYYYYDGTSLGSQLERVVFDDGTEWTQADLRALALLAAQTDGSDTIRGFYADDVLSGGGGGDMLNGLGGNDLLDGGSGDDFLYGGEGDDVYVGGAGTDVLGDSSSTSSDRYHYNLGDGADTLGDNGGVDTVLLGSGISPADTAVRRGTSGQLVLTFADGGSLTLSDQYNGSTGAAVAEWQIEQLVFADGTVWDQAQLRALAVVGTPSGETINGFATADVMSGGGGNDNLYGLGGDDTLDGGADTDYLSGGAGSDVLIGGSGTDNLVGGEGDDTYEGGTGTDSMSDDAAASNDLYRYNLGDGADSIVDSGGTDQVHLGGGITAQTVAVRRNTAGQLSMTFADGGSLTLSGQYDGATGVAMPAKQIEQIHFADATVWDQAQLRALAVTGGAGNDVLNGFSGADVLSGGAGTDSLVGLAGDDVYRYNLGDGTDTVSDSSGADTVQLGSGIGPESVAVRRNSNGHLILTVADGGTLTLNNQYSGTTGAATLATQIEQVVFADGTVWDQAQLRAQAVTGGTGNDVLNGFDGADVLSGGAGTDSLLGLAGDDVYRYNLGDGIDTVADSSGADTVELGSSILPSAVTVRLGSSGQLVLTFSDGGTLTLNSQYSSAGVAAVATQVEQVVFADGTVWDQAQLRVLAVTGGTGNDTLNGFDGADVLTGGAGNDTVQGAAGDDILHGGIGNDTLADNSTTSNDIYRYNLGDGADTVADSGGADTVQLGSGILPSAVTVRRGTSGQVVLTFSDGGALTLNSQYSSAGVATTATQIEQVVFADGTVWDQAQMRVLAVTGSTGNDTLNGFDGADVLTGGAGNDTLQGAAGDDILHGGTGTDSLTDNSTSSNDIYRYNLGDGGDTVADSGGADTVQLGSGILPSAVTVRRGSSGQLVLTFSDGGTLTLNSQYSSAGVAAPTTQIEQVVFADGTVWDQAQMRVLAVTGGTGNDTLNGFDGADVLTGGAGNDTLQGAAGDDILDGGTGNDAMTGGAGNDTYIVDSTSDTTTESASAGTDTVISSVTLTAGLAANLENLTLSGTNAINGTGNALANTLIGNAAANTLSGLEGADIYDGGAGNDTLNDTSTTSNDTYRFGIGYGLDTITDAGGTDSVVFGAGITADQIGFAASGNHLLVSVAGQADALTVSNWYASTASRIEEFRLSDGTLLSASLIPTTNSTTAAVTATVASTTASAAVIRTTSGGAVPSATGLLGRLVASVVRSAVGEVAAGATTYQPVGVPSVWSAALLSSRQPTAGGWLGQLRTTLPVANGASAAGEPSTSALAAHVNAQMLTHAMASFDVHAAGQVGSSSGAGAKPQWEVLAASTL